MDERVQISVGWRDLRRLATCAGLAMAFDPDQEGRLRAVLFELDAQLVGLPSLELAAAATADSIREVFVTAEDRP